MTKTQLDKEEALKLLHEKMKNQNLRRHCYSVGKVMAMFFDYYKSLGKDTGNLTKDQWEIAGILHDADWELTKDTPEKHTLELLEWLKSYEVENELLEIFQSHNHDVIKLRQPQTIAEWTLYCCDELTGFIVAVALIMPDKKLSSVTTESILKKFKQKDFAKQVERNQIYLCGDKLGINLENFVSLTLDEMKKNSDLLGL